MKTKNNGPVICITPVSITKQDRRGITTGLFPYPIYNYRFMMVFGNRSFEIELKKHQNLIYLGQSSQQLKRQYKKCKLKIVIPVESRK